ERKTCPGVNVITIRFAPSPSSLRRMAGGVPVRGSGASPGRIIVMSALGSVSAGPKALGEKLNGFLVIRLASDDALPAGGMVLSLSEGKRFRRESQRQNRLRRGRWSGSR